MEFKALVGGIADFSSWKHADKIRLVMWHWHRETVRDWIAAGDIAAYFDAIHEPAPQNIGSFLEAMVKSGDALRESSKVARYKLARGVRDRLEGEWGQRTITLQIHQALEGLPVQMPDVYEKQFLEETLLCLRGGAFRAAIVMAWNLAYDHMLNWIIVHHLNSFNSAIGKRFPRKAGFSVTGRDDFVNLKESEAIEIANTAGVLPNMYKPLLHGLDTRNRAAHPSDATFLQPVTEGFIDDLLRNVVLRMV